MVINTSTTTPSLMFFIAFISDGYMSIECSRGESTAEKDVNIATGTDSWIAAAAVGVAIAGVGVAVLVSGVLVWKRYCKEQAKLRRRSSKNPETFSLKRLSTYEDMDETGAGYLRYSDPVDHLSRIVGASSVHSSAAVDLQLKSNVNLMSEADSTAMTNKAISSRRVPYHHLHQLASTQSSCDEDIGDGDVYEEYSNVTLGEEGDREELRLLQLQLSSTSHHEAGTRKTLQIVQLHRKQSDLSTNNRIHLPTTLSHTGPQTDQAASDFYCEATDIKALQTSKGEADVQLPASSDDHAQVASTDMTLLQPGSEQQNTVELSGSSSTEHAGHQNEELNKECKLKSANANTICGDSTDGTRMGDVTISPNGETGGDGAVYNHLQGAGQDKNEGVVDHVEYGLTSASDLGNNEGSLYNHLHNEQTEKELTDPPQYGLDSASPLPEKIIPAADSGNTHKEHELNCTFPAAPNSFDDLAQNSSDLTSKVQPQGTVSHSNHSQVALEPPLKKPVAHPRRHITPATPTEEKPPKYIPRSFDNTRSRPKSKIFAGSTEQTNHEHLPSRPADPSGYEPMPTLFKTSENNSWPSPYKQNLSEGIYTEPDEPEQNLFRTVRSNGTNYENTYEEPDNHSHLPLCTDQCGQRFPPTNTSSSTPIASGTNNNSIVSSSNNSNNNNSDSPACESGQLYMTLWPHVEESMKEDSDSEDVCNTENVYESYT